MKHYLSILSLFLAGHVYSQEPLDSTFLYEMEDSMSSLTIVQIKHPKKLLMDITKQLSLDMMQEPSRRKYEVEEIYETDASEPCTSKGIVLADASLRLRHAKLEGDVSFTGPYRLSPQDSSIIEMSLFQFPEMSPLLEHIEGLSISYGSSILTAIRRMESAYVVTADSISDATGRNIYRVNFSPKEAKITLTNSSIYAMSFYGVAYFDTSTLRLKRARTVSYINTKSPYVMIPSFDTLGLSFYPFYAEVSSHDIHRHCSVSYEEADGRLLVGEMKVAIQKGKKVVTEAVVRRLP